MEEWELSPTTEIPKENVDCSDQRKWYFVGRRTVEIRIHDSDLGVSFPAKMGRCILGLLLGEEEQAWDEEGMTPSSSYCRTFLLLSCVFAAEVIRGMRKSMDGAATNLGRSQAEKDQVHSLELGRFFDGV